MNVKSAARHAALIGARDPDVESSLQPEVALSGDRIFALDVHWMMIINAHRVRQ